ncbi:AP2/ERF family transcription factor [Skeletonema marinoi]|uniref:AP2/ERF family transcription factor n=1 Tax=Skeletonema marinoi TaxID=267567 RepID=A0AAD9DBP8_9STRA|nr:AP2/ERF family transcription factor [Skeletonema marinoi]
MHLRCVNLQVHVPFDAVLYTGVSFYKRMNKWQAKISIAWKSRHIGYYENEEEAAADYARAVFKYKGQGARDKARERRARDKVREQDSFIIDLSDVPSQPPIPKIAGHIKEGASKYTGVTFNKSSNLWQAKIHIEGKLRFIGSFAIDLTGVPPQSPIPKRAGRIKEEGSSKYTGVSFNKRMNKWQAKIHIDGKNKNRHIGYYENEEEAAVDYARAVFKYERRGSSATLHHGSVAASRTYIETDKVSEGNKLNTRVLHGVAYKNQAALGKAREDSFIIDLSDVPPQPPIPKSKGRIKEEGSSKYKGVYFNKQKNKWHAQIRINGKVRLIGYYDNEEEAAADYARAVFKYKGQGELDKAREQDSFIIDLSDVPPQSPIPKSSDHAIKEGASKYTGVTFNKQMNKWQAQIRIDGMNRHIGYYDNEEEAGVDYARAVFKYKGQGHWDRSHDQLGGAAIGGNKTKKCKKVDAFVIELTDVPPQSPIPKSSGCVKEGASKYTGVSFDKRMNKWHAQIMIAGKSRNIGYYENEEEAAVDYARAVFKYKGQGRWDSQLPHRLTSLH